MKGLISLERKKKCSIKISSFSCEESSHFSNAKLTSIVCFFFIKISAACTQWFRSPILLLPVDLARALMYSFTLLIFSIFYLLFTIVIFMVEYVFYMNYELWITNIYLLINYQIKLDFNSWISFSLVSIVINLKCHNIIIITIILLLCQNNDPRWKPTIYVNLKWNLNSISTDQEKSFKF